MSNQDKLTFNAADYIEAVTVGHIDEEKLLENYSLDMFQSTQEKNRGQWVVRISPKLTGDKIAAAIGNQKGNGSFSISKPTLNSMYKKGVITKALTEEMIHTGPHPSQYEGKPEYYTFIKNSNDSESLIAALEADDSIVDAAGEIETPFDSENDDSVANV